MIKTSLKNFFKNLIYVFIPMGILYLFLLIAVLSLAGVAVRAVSATVSDTVALVSNSVEYSEDEVAVFLSEAFSKIDWHGDPFETVKTILATNWLTETVTGFFATLNRTTEGFDKEIGRIVANLKNSLVTGFVIAAVLIVIGIVAANYATRFAVRNKVAKRNFKQFVISYTLVPIFQTALLALSLWLLAAIKLYSLLVFAVFVAMLGVLSLCTSYLVYRDDALKLKNVLTVKNVLKHFAVLCIIAAIDVAVAILLWQLSPLFALLLIVPMVIYSANIADANTDSYVSSLVNGKQSTAS